ncbi:Uncharacterised protein [Candidatus Bilamarchaeum dharawalense]|uniref:Uncharacterized protein n=1 Tax=Candidatus Bilamarchaeum dharawalense TaxID=2885759 RepID=A0A5E4LWN9_9ARCH|nr:Uncharacterised protein [Candidatus Bilamarchaeum dharawalense]
MAESFVGIEIAVIVVTASIVLAGILVGIGRAIGNKKVEHFGLEELIQSVINAAIIGSFAAIVELVGVVSSSVVVGQCANGNVVNQLSCTLDGVNTSLFALFQQVVQTLNILGYYQTMSLDFGAFGLSPFANLASVSNILSLQLVSLNAIMIIGQLNSQIAVFIGQNALGLLFPLGLVLRTLFATRKLGGFLIGLAIGLFIFYPTFILIFPSPIATINGSIDTMKNFTNNSYYATVPIIDLNNNYVLASKLDVMSGRCSFVRSPFYINGTMQNFSSTVVNGSLVNITLAENGSSCDLLLYSQQNQTQNLSVDLSGDLTLISQSNNNAIAKSILYNVLAPIFSLIITIVFVKELAGILGSEIGIKSFTSI